MAARGIFATQRHEIASSLTKDMGGEFVFPLKDAKFLSVLPPVYIELSFSRFGTRGRSFRHECLKFAGARLSDGVKTWENIQLRTKSGIVWRESNALFLT